MCSALTGCEKTYSQASPTPPSWARGNGPRVLAELTRHSLGRQVVGLVDVSQEYPDTAAAGAYVLIDAHIGKKLARNDFRQRPVLVVYRNAAAAKRAVSRSRRNAFAVGTRVMYLPDGFPAQIGRDYQQATGAALG